MAAPASEEQQLISEEWTVEVEKFLKESEQGGTKVRVSMRVPRALITAKPEAYIPQMLSLGPYHHRSLQEEPMGPYHERLSHLSQIDIYKLNSTRDATRNKSIEDFFTKIEEKASEFEQFYDWKINDEEKFGWMMMVDGLFLYQFLKNGLHLLQRDASERHNRCGEILTPTLTSIRCDLVKLENQIPLFLLTEIDEDILKVLSSGIPNLSSFQVSHDIEDIDYEEEHHLLGCMHKYLSSFLQIHKSDDRDPTCYESFMTTIGDMVAAIFALFFAHPAKRGRNDFLDKYNAKELAKAGIKFEPGSDKITFDRVQRRWSAQTCDTSMMITDEYVAKMLDGMAKPLFFAGFLEHAQELKAGIRETLIKNYYRSKIRNTWAEFHGEHLSRPWKALALLTAILVVGLTALQTYCSFAVCQKKS
ncbi:hypothetical protein SUGI_0370800 [Cryptomeria japonica]|nr:hypothetical protein SUGI_0370800 [Cryptomeria japonica]